ncbi:MAG: S41 family peptidase, partial [Rhodospirillales bacterium]|nr:S41 family peptidase [Rhodospirillales bacterium]
MSIRLRTFALAWTFILALSSCAGTDNRPAVQVSASKFPKLVSELTFAAAYEGIVTRYIESIEADAVALEGIRGLSSIDPAIVVNRLGPDVGLSVGTAYTETFKAPVADDVKAWAAVTYDIVVHAREHSPDLAHATPEKIYEAVMDGALSQLDPFSRYAGAEEARKNRAKRQGYVGIGIRFRLVDGYPVIRSVFPDSPAEHAGLKPDDRIETIAGTRLSGLSDRMISTLLRGPEGSTVSLTVHRNAKAIETTIVRAKVIPQTVTAHVDSGFIVMELSGFNENTTRSLRTALSTAIAKNPGSVQGIILDLRGNPGGLLRQAITVSDLFLSSGPIVSTVGRHRDSLQSYQAAGIDIAQGLPIAVLINGKSASSAEIVAAALQERGRAVVIGSASYGKGTVQTVIRLPNDGELTLTWSHLVSPDGHAFNDFGVHPTVCTTLAAEGDSAALKDEIIGKLEQHIHTRPLDDVERRLRYAE